VGGGGQHGQALSCSVCSCFVSRGMCKIALWGMLRVCPPHLPSLSDTPRAPRCQVTTEGQGDRPVSKLYRFQGCAGAEVGQEEFFNRSGVMDMLDTVLEGCVRHCSGWPWLLFGSCWWLIHLIDSERHRTYASCALCAVWAPGTPRLCLRTARLAAARRTPCRAMRTRGMPVRSPPARRAHPVLPTPPPLLLWCLGSSSQVTPLCALRARAGT
jgi:hypothetical protein